MPKRNITVEIPKVLLDQISLRSLIHGRTRNAEFRTLLNFGLGDVGESDVKITLPTGFVRTTLRFEPEILDIIQDRAARFERAVGKEIIRLVAWAIQVQTDRDLALINEMLERRDREARGLQGLAPA